MEVKRSEWAAAPVPPAAAALAAAGFPAWQAALLARRGVASPEEAELFLRPQLEQLHDPRLLTGVPAALERLLAARAAGERVALVGDYDVDGISATAILTAVLEACGVGTRAILPHRLSEGYGFQEVHVERAAAEGCTLILTADCGTTSHGAVAAAQAQGIDVIVTDHHLPEDGPPAGAILINPKQDGCAYPFDELCGAGLAFKLAAAFAAACGREVDPRRLLRIACLGTICDLVPLVGENRVIAALGLEALPETPSPGLRALLRQAGVASPVAAGDVGFRIGPRINAAGRMAEPEPALELLLTRDPERAVQLALRLDAWNRERQAVEQAAVDGAREHLLERGELPRFLVAWSEEWHKGVLGIAAGRLAKEFHRPTVLLQVDGERATGSGRSIPGIHLFRFLSGWRRELERFGGHAQAVGLTAPRAALEGLRRRWEAEAASWDPKLLVRSYLYDGELEAGEVGDELLARVQTLAPFGMGNPRPLFRVGGLRPAAAPRLFGDGHAALTAADAAGARVELVGWGWGERIATLDGPFEVLGRVELDRYLGQPVLHLRDARLHQESPAAVARDT